MRAVFIVPSNININEFSEQISAPDGIIVNGYGWNIRPIPDEDDRVFITVTSSEKVLLGLPWDRIGDLEKVTGINDSFSGDKALEISVSWADVKEATLDKIKISKSKKLI